MRISGCCSLAAFVVETGGKNLFEFDSQEVYVELKRY
jgi:hypothetical protein